MSTQSTSSASGSSSSLSGSGREKGASSLGGGSSKGGGACDVSHIITTDLPDDTEQTRNNAFDDDVHVPYSQESVSDEAHKANDASSKYVVERLKQIYHKHILKAEKRYHLHFNFSLPTDGEIKDSEFDAKPMVLLIGQYSTGKTTFLNHLLGEDFPGMHIGPEPTTDKFMALFHGGDDEDSSNHKINSEFHRGSNKVMEDDTVQSVVTENVQTSGRLIKGNTLTVTPALPFSSLSQFGSAFLNHFVGSSSSSPLLKRITFIDTPGVLSGEKQRINRTYDFGQVSKWFADRSDLILLLFDAHKLDISDEFRHIIDTIRLYNGDKIRCVLNKADCVTREQLVRVYGSLMWSMGKIFDSPEVVRVYTGSYWNGALINDDFEHMFEKDEKLLVQELVDLPRCASERKVNQIVNRVRLVKMHVCILGTLRKMTPFYFGKKRSRDYILNNLGSIMEDVRVQFDLSKGDMPNPKEFVKCLKHFPDFSVFPSVDRRLIRRLDLLIEKDIPKIVSEAEIIASEVRLGQKVKSGMKGDTGEDEADTENNPEKEATNLGLLRNILVFAFICFLFCLCFAEGAYYWTYSKPAYSLSELQEGYSKMTDTTLQNSNPISGDEL
mmetsp:Transcript_40616/g.85285  ORF Transcript_40616/g.85285 Transcript_40616/m.85285 type:complete len:610 (-) Transcript_40616:249-2078(-)